MWDSRPRVTLSFLALAFRNKLGPSVPPYMIRPIQYLSHPVTRFTQSTPSYYHLTSTSYSSLSVLFSSSAATTNSRSRNNNVISNAQSVVDFDIKSIDNDDENDNDNDNLDDEDDDDEEVSDRFPKELGNEIGLILDIIRMPRESCVLVKKKLEQCGVTVSSELVIEVLARIRNDWEGAFTFFLWAGKQTGYAHSLRACHSMIAILGKMRKFDTAWALIMEMKGSNGGQSIVTPQTLLIMIRKYCAVHDVGKAINTFYSYKRFGFEIGMVEFHNLLSALCRYKNVKNAEHLLFCNKDTFPLNTKSFNIILNGWCSIIRSPREGKRVWRQMIESGIPRDVVSYASIISCYSKASEVKVVLKLFERLKAANIAPDRKVYNAVIHALAKANRVQDACNLMKSMEEEGITPNAITFNSLIMPLCKGQKLDEARMAFDGMLKRGLSPTVRTYHAFFDILRTSEEAFELLQKMKMMGCHPSRDTYTMLIRKFCRWRQLDNVSKLWTEMSKNGLDPDRSSYNAMIHGLFLNGKLEEAYKYYQEMKGKNLLPEPKLDEILQAWVSGKQSGSSG